MKVDLGKFTVEQTVDLLKDCFYNLADDRVFDLITEWLQEHPMYKEEIEAWLLEEEEEENE